MRESVFTGNAMFSPGVIICVRSPGVSGGSLLRVDPDESENLIIASLLGHGFTLTVVG